MMQTGLRSGLTVYLYTLNPGTSSAVSQNVAPILENLTMSWVAPGGFGQLTGIVMLKSAKIPRPQFGLFSRVAVMDGPFCVWLGELTQPAYGIDQTNGDYIKLTALGIGDALRDNPGRYSYTNQTAQQIAQAQLSAHTGGSDNSLTALISTDNTQLFPDNPSNLITQVYAGRNMEEILSDAALQAGDYNWGTEADPIKKDTIAGFPLGRVFARARSLSTVDYTASLQKRDLIGSEFSPTADRAYNAIEIDYNNGTSGVGAATSTDSRLAGDLSQGTAPFRYRKYLRDLSGMSVVNGTIAASIASTQLGLFKNPTYTGSASLRRARDASGARIPLWQVQAGKNLFVPELAIQGQQLPTTPTQNVNLFWISQATYREDTTGNQTLDLQLGYQSAAADVQIARLQMASDAIARSNQIATVVQAQGAPMRGQYAISFSNGVAGQTIGNAVEFPALAYQAPTSLTLSSIASSNIGALSVTDLTAVGAFIFGSVSANGAGYARGTYKTNGNCLLQVDATARRIAHHCDECDHIHTDLSLEEEAGHVVVSRSPGHIGLTVVCPRCAGRTMETFHTGLTERDEAAPWEWRATQARLIRALMRAHGLQLQ